MTPQAQEILEKMHHDAVIRLYSPRADAELTADIAIKFAMWYYSDSTIDSADTMNPEQLFEYWLINIYQK